MNYASRYFKIEELVPSIVFKRFGHRSWMFLNPIALQMLDTIREFYDRPVTVNNWLWGGNLENRGFRTPKSDVGASFSQHKLGNAFDLNVENISSEEVRNDILKNQNNIFVDINCLESDVSWVHFDVRNIQDRILIVSP